MNIVEEPVGDYDAEVFEVISADYLGDFSLYITFSNGINQVVNLKPFLESSNHPAIRKYLDEEKFQTFTIVDGNLNWNDYDMIFPLDDLLNGNIQ